MTVGEGLAKSGEMVGGAIAAGMNRYAQLKTGAKVADAVYDHLDAITPDDQPNPLGNEDAWDSKGWSDKVATLQGYMQGQQLQQGQGQQQLLQAQIGRYNAQTADTDAQAKLRAGQEQDEGAMAKYAQTLDEQVNGGDTEDPDVQAVRDQLTPAQKLQIKAAASMGKTNPRVAAAMIKPMMDMFGGGGQPVMPVGATVNGQKMIVNPKTGQWAPVADPNTQPQPVADADGNVYGLNVPNGKGGFTFQPKSKAGGPRFKLIPDPLRPGNMMPTVEADSLDDFQSGWQALKQMQGGTEAGAGDAGTGGGASKPVIPVPSPADIKYLKANPALAPKFEGRFGKGAAKKYLTN